MNPDPINYLNILTSEVEKVAHVAGILRSEISTPFAPLGTPLVPDEIVGKGEALYCHTDQECNDAIRSGAKITIYLQVGDLILVEEAQPDIATGRWLAVVANVDIQDELDEDDELDDDLLVQVCCVDWLDSKLQPGYNSELQLFLSNKDKITVLRRNGRPMFTQNDQCPMCQEPLDNDDKMGQAFDLCKKCVEDEDEENEKRDDDYEANVFPGKPCYSCGSTL